MAKKNLTITLYMSELLYDVQNKTYLTGKSRSTGSNHEEVANMQANEDEENQNQILRSIGNAFSLLRTKLSEYIDEQSTSSINGNNILTSDEKDLNVTLVMPSNYNVASREAISTAMHQYIVNTAIGDWFTITNKSDASDYVTMSAANLEEIREAINKRFRPTRKNVSSL